MNENIPALQRIVAASLTPTVSDTHACPYMVIPDGFHAHAVEKTLARPYRRRGNVDVSRIPDFTRLILADAPLGGSGPSVTAREAAAGSRRFEIFADQAREKFTAVLNFETWRDWTISLAIRKSVHFSAVEEALPRVRSQRDLIRFIEDTSCYITKPEAAAMLEVAQKFRAIQNVRFVSVQETANGNCNIEFIKTNEAGTSDAKGALQKLPEEFEVTLPVYEGEELSTLTVRISYDLADGKLSFGLTFFRLNIELRRLAEERVKRISEELGGCPVSIGSAAPIAPVAGL